MFEGKTGIARLQLELKEIKKEKGLHQIGGSVGIINKDYKHWKACFIGPAGTPYENGLYFIEFKLKDDYPKTRPLARFKTKIWHPNVDENTGEICLDYIKSKWNKENTMRESILSIFYLLNNPIFNSRLNTKVNESDFVEKAKEYKNKYAFQSQQYNWMEGFDNWDWK